MPSEVIKFSAPGGKSVMELYGDQVEVAKDCFTIIVSISVLPLQNKALEARPSSYPIVTKEIKIGIVEKPKMITVGFNNEIMLITLYLTFLK